MAEQEARDTQYKSGLSNLIAADFAATTQKRMQGFADAQTELVKQCQDANRYWLDRIEAEVNIASEFAVKLTAARSIPEAITACQGWGSHRLEMMAEDSRHFRDDTQKFMQTGMRLIANGWQSEGPGIST
ncbi:MAG TPA: phasin family protein [Xanthobacteraceae bacterium]